MAIYIVSYELNSNNYDDLYKAIKEIGTWAHYIKNSWFIYIPEANETNGSVSSDIAASLQKYLNERDKLFVGKLEGESAWFNLDVSKQENESKWLEEHFDKSE